MKTITFDETKWKLVPVEVDPDMVGAFVDASAIEGPCWAEATDGEKQEVVRMWAQCWAALLAATPAPAPAQPIGLPQGITTSQDDGKWRVTLAFDSRLDAEALRAYMAANGVPTVNFVIQPSQEPAQEVILTDEERQQVFRDAENRMVREINLSWRTAVVDEVIAALRAKVAS